ncbi:TonB-dependent siderophore receptor [Methylomicrobium lacus]|uniref:TonB-dependent siderophore receptor n=1 Tax=Methylomicrobium lacus TaxID=136992 RepID=UPI0035A8C284
MHTSGDHPLFGKHRKTAPLTLYVGLAVLAAPPLQAGEPASAPSVKAADNGKRHFDIGKQPLYSALSSLAEQSGIQFVYAPDMVKGKTSPGVAGDYTTAEALRRVLENSGLGYRFGGANTITLERIGSAQPTQNNSHLETLPPMTVKGHAEYDPNDPYGTDYAVPNAVAATKTDTPIFDTPVSVQVVSKAVINDQQAIGLDNVLKNVSGVSKGWGFGSGVSENLQIRGFINDSIYRDGVLTPNSINISLANVQRVEVLKGPAGMLFGRTQPGGLVNVITKRPQQESYHSLQQQFGSYDTYRTLLDSTGAITQDGALSYRLNYEHLGSNSFRDFAFDDRDFVAPSLTWMISKDTQLDLDFMYQNRKTVSDSGIPFDLQLSGVIPGKIPRHFRGNEPTDYNNDQFYEGDVTLTHRIDDDWKVRGRFSIIRDSSATAQTFSNGNTNLQGDLARGFLKTAGQFGSEYGTVDLTGHFSTGDLKHTLLAGTDFYHGSDAGASSPFRGNVPTINVFNPVYGFSDFLNDPIGPFNKTKNEWYGFYLQDQVALWKQWQLLFGSRFDHAEFKASGSKKRVDEFSPRVGLLYHPLPWLGIYADYVKTFNAANQGTTVTGDIPDPEKSREYEVGLKGEWLDGRLTANLAFFELTKRNIQTPLPAPFVNKVAITGEQRSRGIELDLHGQLTDDWNVIATYAYTDTEVTKDSAPLDTVIGSSGSGNTGNRFANVPRHAGSVWTTYDFSRLGAQGFSGGTGVYLASDRAGNIDNSFEMPGYARVDAMLKYRHQVGPSNVTWQFNIVNLLDKEYIASSNGFASFIHQTQPGVPRTFLGLVKVEF